MWHQAYSFFHFSRSKCARSMAKNLVIHGDGDHPFACINFYLLNIQLLRSRSLSLSLYPSLVTECVGTSCLSWFLSYQLSSLGYWHHWQGGLIILYCPLNIVNQTLFFFWRLWDVGVLFEKLKDNLKHLILDFETEMIEYTAENYDHQKSVLLKQKTFIDRKR